MGCPACVTLHCRRPIDMASPEMSCGGKPYAAAPGIPASPLGIVAQYCLDLLINRDPRLVTPDREGEAMSRVSATLMSRMPPNSGLRFVDLFPAERHVLATTVMGPPPSPPTGYFSRLRCKWPSRANAPFYAVRTSSPKHRIPGCRRSSAVNAQTSQSELSLADAMHQLDAGDRERRIPEPLEP
jgi:hypothetical protein